MVDERLTQVDSEGLDEATVARLLSLSAADEGVFEALSRRERRVWLRLKYHRLGAAPPEVATGLTSDDLRRLGMLPATPQDDKDAYWQDLHGKLHTPRA